MRRFDKEKFTGIFFPSLSVNVLKENPIYPSNSPNRAEKKSPLGLYVHIPFCRSKCNYCAFISAPPRNEEEIDRYIEAVCTHLIEGKKLAGSRPLRTIYLGGGTPSLVGADRIVRIVTTIQKAFSILPDAEITLEANPESSSLELFQILHAIGINRISLGAQSFQDVELKQLGRVHTARQIVQAIEIARQAGIENVSLDLIFALPGHSLPRWQDTIHQALALGPDHLSIYGLTYEEGTRLDQWRIQGKVTPVLDETYRTMYDWTRRYLADSGWIQYEISNWSRPGKSSRHNQIYWRRDDYLAAGISAHGMMDYIRYSLIRDLTRYTEILLKKKESGEFGYWHPGLLDDKVQLTMEEMASDVMIFGLREIQGISIPSFTERFGYSPWDRWKNAIERLVDRRLLEQIGERLRLTDEAVPISNEVFIHFLD